VVGSPIAFVRTRADILSSHYQHSPSIVGAYMSLHDDLTIPPRYLRRLLSYEKQATPTQLPFHFLTNEANLKDLSCSVSFIKATYDITTRMRYVHTLAFSLFELSYGP
jgi:hypothetical protein